MRRVVLLFIDGLRCRKAATLVLCIQVLVASLVVAQALFLVGDLWTAAKRLDPFGPLGGWYQLSDAGDPEAFQKMSSSPDFEANLADFYAWVSDNQEIDLVVLPKTSIFVDDGSETGVDLRLVSGNLATYFDLDVVEGEWPDESQATGSRPVILGHEYAREYAVGDRLTSDCHVAAILAPGARCFDIGAGMQPIELDGMMLTPVGGAMTDVGTLDGVMNAPIVRFVSESSKDEFAEKTRAQGLYTYKFWRLDDFLTYYRSDLTNQISLEAAAVAIILVFAISAFLLGILRSISSRRREFGIHLAYGAAHSDFWLATFMEFVAVIIISCALPLSVIDPPYWEAAVMAMTTLALGLSLLPATVLARRTIPDLVRGSDG